MRIRQVSHAKKTLPIKSILAGVTAAVLCMGGVPSAVVSAGYPALDVDRGINDYASINRNGNEGVVIGTDFASRNPDDAVLSHIGATDMTIGLFSGDTLVDRMTFTDIVNRNAFMDVPAENKYGKLSLIYGFASDDYLAQQVDTSTKDENGVTTVFLPTPALASKYVQISGVQNGDTICVSIADSNSGNYYFVKEITAGTSLYYAAVKGCSYQFTNTRTGESVFYDAETEWGNPIVFSGKASQNTDVMYSPYTYVTIDISTISYLPITFSGNSSADLTNLSFEIYRDGAPYTTDDAGNPVNIDFEAIVFGTKAFAVNKEDAGNHTWSVKASAKTASHPYLNADVQTEFSVDSNIALNRVSLPEITQKMLTVSIDAFPGENFEAYYLCEYPDQLAAYIATETSSLNDNQFSAVFSLPAGNYRFKNTNSNAVSDIVSVSSDMSYEYTDPDKSQANYRFELFDCFSATELKAGGYFMNTDYFEQNGWMYADILELPENFTAGKLYNMHVKADGYDAWQYVFVNEDGSYSIKSGMTLAGDANNDGEFSVVDVVSLQKYLLGKDVSCSVNADLTGNGSLDVFDLVMMKKALLNT